MIAHASRYLGAFAVLATGVAHFEQYSVDDYSTVPTIGTLFLLNFIASIVIAFGLIAPIRRVTARYTDAVRAVFALGGIGLGVLSLAALFVSESSGLFGFVEHGYRMAIVVAIVVEVAEQVCPGPGDRALLYDHLRRRVELEMTRPQPKEDE